MNAKAKTVPLFHVSFLVKLVLVDSIDNFWLIMYSFSSLYYHKPEKFMLWPGHGTSLGNIDGTPG